MILRIEILAGTLHEKCTVIQKPTKNINFKNLKIIKKLTNINPLGKSRRDSSGFSSLVPIHHASEKTICSQKKELLIHNVHA